MVALDGTLHSGARHAGSQPILNVKLTLAGFVGIGAAVLSLGTMAAHGFNDGGIRLGSEISWRLASFVFFVAVVAGPICRLMPLAICKSQDSLRRQLIWSFCASYGVFLATLVLPNSLGGVTHDDTTAGMTLFALFGGMAMAVLAYSASRKAVEQLGEKASRALLSVAGSFFWLTYALTGLAHLSGPHRPDMFYGVSLSLMILALLVRFADRLVAKLRGSSPVPVS